MKTVYKNMLLAQKSGALMLIGRPGTAKSAILAEIAKDEGWQYIDLRLTMLDEISVGLYPSRPKKAEDGAHYFDFAVPDWARKANEKPTLVVFDELNRARKEVLNAAFQILVERAIGDNFKFNENVKFAATGNLGEEDGTDVHELDPAILSGRVNILRHELLLDDWIKGYAEEHVDELIIGFLKANPQYFWKAGEAGSPIACARSWTNLSNYLALFENIRQKRNACTDGGAGASFVGQSILRFASYLEQQEAINIEMILDDYEAVKKRVKLNRAQTAELLTNLAAMNVMKLTKAKTENAVKFLKDLPQDDNLVSFFYEVISKAKSEDMPKLKKKFGEFQEIFDILKKNNGLEK